MCRKYILVIFLLAVAYVGSYTTNVSAEGNSDEVLWHQSNQFTQPEQDRTLIKSRTDSFDSFIAAGESDDLQLYVEPDTLALKIRSKKTGYIWDSAVGQDAEVNLNQTWMDMANSALTITYLDRRDKLKTESLVTNDSTVDLLINDDGFSAQITFSEAEIELTLMVRIEGDRLVVDIPDEKLTEPGKNRIVSLRVYPFLGAAINGSITVICLFLMAAEL